MTGTPAVRQVVDAIVDALTTGMPDVFICTDRDDNAPLDADAGEIPGVIVRAYNFFLSTPEYQGALQWTGTIKFDCISGGGAGLTIDGVNQITIAEIIKVLAQPANVTLGGLVEELIPTAMDSSEQSVPDVGWAVLDFSVTFYTPSDDPYTIANTSQI